MGRAVFALLLFASIADAQAISIYAPPMPLHRVRAGEWLTNREDCDVMVTWAGKTIRFKASIDPTAVHGILRRYVDPCTLAGLSETGHALHLNLPREPVVGAVAQAMVSPGWFTTPDGVSHAATVTWPACRSRRAGLGRRIADAVTATGSIR